jgi:hypothetical protein
MKTPLILLAGAALLTIVGLASAASREAQEREAATAVETRTVAVPARANIFGAGRATPPAPGGGGAGVLPPLVRLGSSARAVTFPRIVGRVNPISSNDDWNGPEGDRKGPTDVQSLAGISGIVHGRNGMFLVGVFLGDGAAPRSAPPRLDFTSRERFGQLSPRVGQTFLVGDGKGRIYGVPSGATRLFLGFADAYLYVGPPGWYDNNAGRVVATVRIATS